MFCIVLPCFVLVFVAPEVSDTESTTFLFPHSKAPEGCKSWHFSLHQSGGLLLVAAKLESHHWLKCNDFPSLKHFVRDAGPNEGVAYKEKSRHGGDSCFKSLKSFLTSRLVSILLDSMSTYITQNCTSFGASRLVDSIEINTWIRSFSRLLCLWCRMQFQLFMCWALKVHLCHQYLWIFVV